MPRRQTLRCPAEVRDIFVQALSEYIDVGFPEDGTDCSQVARESLRDAIRELQQDGSEPGVYLYNRRIRAFLKEALKHRYARRSGGYAQELTLMLLACDGETVTQAAVEDARHQDGQV